MNDLLARDLLETKGFFDWALPWRSEMTESSPGIKLDLQQTEANIRSRLACGFRMKRSSSASIVPILILL